MVEGAVWIQFHGPRGGAIGPIVHAHSPAKPHMIRATFQLIDGVRLAWGPICGKILEATRIRVGIGSSSAAISLKTPEEVCVSPNFNASLVAPTFPIPPLCTAEQLATTLEGTQGASMTFWTTILFENVSKSACVVSGFPSVQAADGPGGELVGPPAAKTHPRGSGLPAMDLNHTGVRTHATYAQREQFQYARGSCEGQNAPGINVGILGYAPVYLAYKVEVCTKVNSTFVTHVGVWAL